MNRVLIVRLGALGDIVHAIPVAAALRRRFPSARIDWVVSSKHREILELVPVLDNRIVVNDRRGTTGGLPIAAVIGRLRRAHYDVALDLQGLIKSALIARASGAARVIGFGRSNLREPLAGVLYTTRYEPGGSLFDRRDTRHVVYLNLSMLQVLGVEGVPAQFPLAEVESDVAVAVRERSTGGYALLNPGAAWPNKRWPPSRFAELAVALYRRFGLPSVVLWGPGERELGDEVVQRAGGVALLTPQTSIADVVALARGAAVMVSGDTGPTHIAAAVGTPVVGIYGPTRPERNGPWLPEDSTVSRAEQCECHHLRQCRRERMCLLDIGADEVMAAVVERLKKERHHG